jgi:hypothetical protein
MDVEHRETVDLSKATIEHLLPQSITPEWKNELGANAKEIHSNLINTFGNLTLTAYNAELGNLTFAEKKAKLENTHIELNRWILQQENWRAGEIETRAKYLLRKAKQIWVAPADIAK